mmetsp:Transcript_72907/g.144909  ORF Transcript_72907/g.144909 Transcript_72907/m.144909 type:complete len:200 (+) Transcript_72907:1352-1951(+)
MRRASSTCGCSATCSVASWRRPAPAARHEGATRRWSRPLRRARWQPGRAAAAAARAAMRARATWSDWTIAIRTSLRVCSRRRVLPRSQRGCSECSAFPWRVGTSSVRVSPMTGERRRGAEFHSLSTRTCRRSSPWLQESVATFHGRPTRLAAVGTNARVDRPRRQGHGGGLLSDYTHYTLHPGRHTGCGRLGVHEPQIP